MKNKKNKSSNYTNYMKNMFRKFYKIILTFLKYFVRYTRKHHLEIHDFKFSETPLYLLNGDNSEGHKFCSNVVFMHTVTSECSENLGFEIQKILNI